MIYKSLNYFRQRLTDQYFYSFFILGSIPFVLLLLFGIRFILFNIAALVGFEPHFYNLLDIWNLTYEYYQNLAYSPNRWISLIVIAPLWETYVFFHLPFRFILPYFEKKNWIKSFIHLNAIIFGLMHLFIDSFLSPYIYGLIWGYIWYSNKDYPYIAWKVVVAHAFVNMIHILLANLI